MASPVARAASSAGALGRLPEPLIPHRAMPTSPALAAATPAVCHGPGCSPTKTSASTVTTSGAVPRAMGYTWPKSPSWKERISRSWYPRCSATELSRYGQQSASGSGANAAMATPQTVSAAPISAKATSWSLMPWAIAFHEACATAAASTAAATSGVTGTVRPRPPRWRPRVRAACRE
jgi:hypothetical protein